MLSFLRSFSFWYLDKLKGNKIKKNIQEIEDIFNSSYDSKLVKEHQGKNIENIINIAINNTEYYKEYKKNSTLTDLPVVTKKEILKNQKDFLSCEFKQEKLIQMSTSGSTGTPFTSFQNIDKKKRVNAETIFFNGLAGYKVGNKLIHMRSLNLLNKKSGIKQWIQNERLLDIDKLDNESIDNIFKNIEKLTIKSKATTLSYASTYDALASYIIANNQVTNNKRIDGLISTSEILYDQTRRILMEFFDCNMYSRYANMENGILGQDHPKHTNTFIINEANYYFEILKLNSNEPVEDGEIGRIVITDLYNYAMPMIRYDTGDIGSFNIIEVDGIRKKAITNFGGRQIDMIFDEHNEYVSPHKISVSFWGYDEIEEFQFVQKETGKYEVYYKSSVKFTKVKKLKSSLKEILGDNSSIKFTEVNEIPTLKSGKRKYIINAMV